LVFDVFYLHKYSHGFSPFNDIVIQFFQKRLVMTVATLPERGLIGRNNIEQVQQGAKEALTSQ